MDPPFSPPTPNPHPWDGFLMGEENALAYAGVMSLARGDGAGVSPLVVHGPSGVGKSRLLAGLVSERMLRLPESVVAHLEAEAFAAACAEAAGRRGGWGELRERFRGLDLFVLEDLHALERAPLALVELTHTLDALDEAGAGVAVSARVGPGQWTGWPSRLVNRLVGGLSVRVDPPSLATRRRYLLDRARARGLGLAAEAVDALAEAAESFPALDGWLTNLALASRVERRPLDRALVDPYLADQAVTTSVTIDQVARAVAVKFGVPLRDLRSSTRRKTVVQARHLAIHLARQLTGKSFRAIGTYFGDRDAATIRHACGASASRLASDPALAASVAALRRRWPGGA